MGSFSQGWNPANSSYCQTGEMICCSCSKKIHKKQWFQYRQKSKAYDWYYQCQHSACAENKKDWDVFFAQEKKAKEQENHVNQIIEQAGLSEDRGDYCADDVIWSLIGAGFEIKRKQQ